MFGKQKYHVAFLTLLSIIAFSATSLAGKPNDKGGGNTPPPEPAPVNYALSVLSMPGDYESGTANLRDMNDSGEGVGYYYLPDGNRQPFYFDAYSGQVIVTNLNDLALDVDWPMPAGWQFAAAYGINKHGDIAGKLTLSSDPTRQRGFILELRPVSGDPSIKPRLHLPPDNLWTTSSAMAINDVGQVLGHIDSSTGYIYQAGLHGLEADAQVSVLPFQLYAGLAEMNNPTAEHGTQIVSNRNWGEVVRYTLGDIGVEVLSVAGAMRLDGLSDSGSFCGYREYKKFRYTGFVYGQSLQDLGGSQAVGINSDNDVVGPNDNAATTPLLHHATHGTIDLRVATVAGSEYDFQLWNEATNVWASQVTKRNVVGSDPAVSDFPMIGGSFFESNSPTGDVRRIFILFPIPMETP